MKFHRSLVVAPTVVLLQACLTLPALGATVHRAPQATPPSKLMLTLTDVRAAYGSHVVSMGKGLQSDSMPGLSGLQVAKSAGLVSLNETMYTRPGASPLIVVVGVNLFHTTSQASSGIRRLITTYNLPVNRKAGVRISSLGGIGSTAAIMSFAAGSGAKQIHGLGISFSEGVYTGTVMVYSGATVDRSKLQSLASRLDSRIRAG